MLRTEGDPTILDFSFHQATLEEALELRNVGSVENLTNRGHYEVAKRNQRRLSLDAGEKAENKILVLHQISTIGKAIFQFKISTLGGNHQVRLICVFY